jgi:hypothetical protein
MEKIITHIASNEVVLELVGGIIVVLVFSVFCLIMMAG